MNTQAQKIGLMSAIIICMNAMIGAGIFSTPAKLATSVGPAGILTYGLVIIAVLFIALSIARLAQTYPEPGSFYTYTKKWGGHAMGLFAAGCYSIGITIAMGLLARIEASYIHAYLPDISVTTIGLSLLALILVVNIAGAKFVQAGQMFLICCTLFSIIATIVVCLAHADLANLTPFAPHGVAPIFSATKAAIFAFFGFESAASLYATVKNPEKNVPIAITVSILIVGALYVLFIGSIILAIPTHIFTDSYMPLSQALMTAIPRFSLVAHLVSIAIITALLGVLQSMTYSVSLLIQSFLSYMQTPAIKQFAASSKSVTVISAILVGFMAFNFLAVKNIDLFFNMTAVCIVLAFVLSMLALVIDRRSHSITTLIIATLGIITGSAILLSAVYDLVMQFAKLF